MDRFLTIQFPNILGKQARHYDDTDDDIDNIFSTDDDASISTIEITDASSDEKSSSQKNDDVFETSGMSLFEVIKFLEFFFLHFFNFSNF